nr:MULTISPECIES: DUF433 domain-containing protein [unclassified Pseudomonas]
MTPQVMTKAVSTEVAYVSSATEAEVNRLVDEDLLPEVFLKTKTRREYDLLGTALTVCINRLTKNILTKAARRVALRQWAESDYEKVWYIAQNGRKEAASSEHFVLALWPQGYNPKGLKVVDDQEVKVVVDLTSEIKKVLLRFRSLHEAANVVISDPNVMGGMPVFKGTRLPVETVLASIDAGEPFATLKEGYPFLTEEMIDLARVYLDTHPRRGRPRKTTERPGWTKLKSEAASTRGKA